MAQAAANKSRAAYFRQYRARKKAERERDAAEAAQRDATVAEFEGPPDIGEAIAWIEATLKVPTGPLAGKPFRVEPFQREWLHCAYADGVREAGMSIARKNGKSGFIAAVLLAGLIGPLNRRGWRGVVGSMTGFLATELRDAMIDTAKVSGLWDQLTVKRAPPPGHMLGRRGSRLDFLATDKGTGHAIGADLALIDEAGLMPENQRATWNALYTAISGRNGRFWAISIQGTGPMFAEMEDRAGSPRLHWKKWSAPLDCEISDQTAWHAANPGLVGGIKSLDYMADAAERAEASSANEMHFRQYDLNQPVDAERQVIVQVADYRECIVDDPPPLEGDIVVGVDLGANRSMTCVAALSIETNRLRVWGAFGDDPPLSVRAKGDRMGAQYDVMVREGELRLYPGRVTPVVPFLKEIIGEIGEMGRICALGADRFRKAEAKAAFEEAGVPRAPVYWRGQGASGTADGSHDVRAFQRAIHDHTWRLAPSTMLECAIAASVLRFDGAGNPALNKAANNARIDALSAAVIAAGLSEIIKPAPLLQFHVVGKA